MRPVDEGAFKTHRAAVAQRLRDSLRTNRIEPIGSFTRGAAIRQGSDLDLLCVLSRDEVYWGNSLKASTTVLSKVRSELQGRFAFSDIGRDGQAVVVSFSDGRSIDVVPAYYHGQGGPWNYPIFGIPDGNGGWMATSPQAHSRYINEADAASGGMLKNTVKLVKFWRQCRDPAIPLASFHLELLLAQEGTCKGVKTYRQCLRDAFTLLRQREVRALQDPLGISGHVKAANTDSKRQHLVSAVAYAADHARTAVLNEAIGQFGEAYRQWDMVFNGSFPKA